MRITRLFLIALLSLVFGLMRVGTVTVHSMRWDAAIQQRLEVVEGPLGALGPVGHAQAVESTERAVVGLAPPAASHRPRVKRWPPLSGIVHTSRSKQTSGGQKRCLTGHIS